MNWANIVKWMLRLAFIVAVTTLAWFNLAASIMAVCAVVLVALVGKLESLVEFSFGPLKAKIERNLSESEKLLQQLKSFAAIQARAANDASVNTGRFSSGSDWIYQSIKRVETGLRELNVSEEEIVSARSDFVRLTIGDAGRAATGGGYVPLKLGQAAVDDWHALHREERGNPDAVEGFLVKWNALTPERIERIRDMRWMIEHKDVRDSEQYMRAHTEVLWEGGQK
jgi:hypothetical protein